MSYPFSKMHGLVLTALLSLLTFTSAASVPLLKRASNSFASRACSLGKSVQSGYSNSSFTFTTSSGVNRTYTVYVPVGYSASKPNPLVFSFHGRNGSSDVQFQLTQLGNTTFNTEYVSIFPQGLLGTGNQSAWQGASYASPQSNDTQFIDELLTSLGEAYCIDYERVYATGKSNGGGFVDTLACSRPGARFAAFSSCSGAFYTDNAVSDCPVVQPVTPYIDFHGSIDDTVPYDGKNASAGGNEPPIPKWLGFWAKRNGCNSSAANSTFLPQYGSDVVNLTTYSCGTPATRNVVEAYW